MKEEKQRGCKRKMGLLSSLQSLNSQRTKNILLLLGLLWLCGVVDSEFNRGHVLGYRMDCGPKGSSIDWTVR